MLKEITSTIPNMVKLFVKVKVGSRKFLIGSIYRPSKREMFCFDVEFEPLMQATDRTYTVILPADMIFHFLRNIKVGVEFVPQFSRPIRVTGPYTFKRFQKCG